MDPFATLLKRPPFLLLLTEKAQRQHTNFLKAIQDIPNWNNPQYVSKYIEPYLDDHSSLLKVLTNPLINKTLLTNTAPTATIVHQSVIAYPVLTLVQCLEQVQSFTQLAVVLQRLHKLFDCTRKLLSEQRRSEDLRQQQQQSHKESLLHGRLAKEVMIRLHKVHRFDDAVGDNRTCSSCTTSSIEALKPKGVLEAVCEVICVNTACRKYVQNALMHLVRTADELIRLHAGVDKEGTSGDRRSVRELLDWLVCVGDQMWEFGPDLIESEAPLVLLMSIRVLKSGDPRLGREVFRLASTLLTVWSTKGLKDDTTMLQAFAEWQRNEGLQKVTEFESYNVAACTELAKFDPFMKKDSARFLDSMTRIAWTLLKVRKDEIDTSAVGKAIVEICTSVPITLLWFAAQEEDEMRRHLPLLQRSALSLAVSIVFDYPDLTPHFHKANLGPLFQPLFGIHCRDIAEKLVALPNRLLLLAEGDLNDLPSIIKALKAFRQVRQQAATCSYMKQVAAVLLEWSLTYKVFNYFDPDWTTQSMANNSFSAFDFMHTEEMECKLGQSGMRIDGPFDSFKKAVDAAARRAMPEAGTHVSDLISAWLEVASSNPVLVGALIEELLDILKGATAKRSESSAVAIHIRSLYETCTARMLLAFLATKLEVPSEWIEEVFDSLRKPLSCDAVNLRPHELRELATAVNVCLTAETLAMIHLLKDEAAENSHRYQSTLATLIIRLTFSTVTAGSEINAFLLDRDPQLEEEEVLLRRATESVLNLITDMVISDLRTLHDTSAATTLDPYWNGILRLITWLPHPTIVTLGEEILMLSRWSGSVVTTGYLRVLAVCLYRSARCLAEQRTKSGLLEDEDGEDGEIYLASRRFADNTLPKCQAVPIEDAGDPDRVCWAICAIRHALYLHTTQKIGFLSRFHQCWPALELAATQSSWLALAASLRTLNEICIVYGGTFVSHRLNKGPMRSSLEKAFRQIAISLHEDFSASASEGTPASRGARELITFLAAAQSGSAAPVTAPLGLPLTCLLIIGAAADDNDDNGLQTTCTQLLLRICKEDPYTAGRLLQLIEGPDALWDIINDRELASSHARKYIEVSVAGEKVRSLATTLRTLLWGCLGIGSSP